MLLLRVLQLVLFNVSTFAVDAALADYVTFPANGGTNFVFPAGVSAGRNTAVGTVIATQNPSLGLSSSVTCVITQTTTVNGTLVPGMPKTYQTNVSGIGVRFYITSGFAGPWEQAPTSSTFSNSGGAAHYTRADLVATGPIQSDTLTTLPSFTVTYTGTCISTVTYTQIISAGTAITGSTCNVTNSTVSVRLPKIAPSAIPTVGSTAGDTAFAIALDCPASAKVYVTLTDAVNNANRSTTLSLDPGSSAAGVGLQVLFGSNPVAYGADSPLAGNQNQWLAGTASGGAMQVQLVARYIRTSASLIMGTVNGRATFTMSYQ